jgi:hypothetical protein
MEQAMRLMRCASIFAPGRSVGQPVAVVDSVAVKATGVVDFALSDNGTLLYPASNSGASSGFASWRGSIVPARETVLDAPPRLYAYARLAPDNLSIALDARDQQQDMLVMVGVPPGTGHGDAGVGGGTNLDTGWQSTHLRLTNERGYRESVSATGERQR